MFNNGFPATYPQMNWPYQQQNVVQGMTRPTIHADIVQVSDENEAWNEQVAAGGSQMMMARDESAIYIKSAYPNSEPTLDIYVKQSRKEKNSEYVTREELQELIAALKPQSRTKSAEKKEDE